MVDIKRLIPQRNPILMVDELVSVEGNIASTLFVVKANEFLCEDSHLTEAGLIEHIAQSASSFAGYKAIDAGAANPPEGMIGEVKRFTLHRFPSIGEKLQTEVIFGAEIGGVTIVDAKTMVGDETIAETKLKIAI